MLGMGLPARLLVVGVAGALIYTAISSGSRPDSDWRGAFECRFQACPELSDSALRERVIKSYLHTKLEENASRAYAGGSDQLVLLPMPADALDLMREVEEETLLKSLHANALLLRTHAEIDLLDAEVINAYSAIANYSLNHRNVDVIPLKSFQRASENDIARHQYLYKRSPPVFDDLETTRGYGRKFYWIQEFGGISLACCDGLERNDGTNKRWHKDYSIVNLSKIRPQILSITDGGGILIRPSIN